MSRPKNDVPRPVKVVRRNRRTWANGETHHYYLLTVPNEVAEKIEESAAFHPILLEDGSILFKRWDASAFGRWLVEQGESQ